MSTTTNAHLILASHNDVTGDVLYTWVLTFPRVILAEVNTHRMGSKNTTSSRAIPAHKQRKKVYEDPFVPAHIGANQRGMQASSELSGFRRAAAVGIWRGARFGAIAAHYALDKLGIHKQVVNRVIEPWTWTQQVFSATDVNNLILLRDHKDAEPHFHELAKQMHWQVEYVRNLLNTFRGPGVVQSLVTLGTIQSIGMGKWHLPFVDELDRVTATELLGTAGGKNWWELLKKISAARCARVSYTLPENGQRSDLIRDIELYKRLAGSNPKHLSPLEHQATPLSGSTYLGNFRGWKQFRKEIAFEHGGDRGDS